MTAEGIGTLLLTLAAVGSADAAARAFTDAPGMVLVVTAIAIPGALVGLILALGKVSGGHFNPLISAMQWLSGERTLPCTLGYLVAQCLGAIVGSLLADMLFADGLGGSTAAPRGALLLSEFVASTGLMVVVLGCSRSGRAETGPFAVGAWLTAAILAFPSGSLANPAIIIGALLARGPLQLDGATAVLFIACELAGALLALGVIQILHPAGRKSAPIGSSGANPLRGPA